MVLHEPKTHAIKWQRYFLSHSLFYCDRYSFNSKIVVGKPLPLNKNDPKLPIKSQNIDTQIGAGLLLIGWEQKTEVSNSSNSSVEVSIKFESDTQVKMHAKGNISIKYQHLWIETYVGLNIFGYNFYVGVVLRSCWWVAFFCCCWRRKVNCTGCYWWW